MASRHNNLTGDGLDRQRALDRSWNAAKRLLDDGEFRDYLEAAIERVNGSDEPPLTREEFLAQTGLDD